MYYTFDNGATWSQTQKLVAFDGAVDARFGNDISISGNVLVLGAFRDNDNGADSGKFVSEWSYY